MHDGHSHSPVPVVEGEHSIKEIFKFLLVIAAILCGSLFLVRAYGPMGFGGWARWFMGLFFVVFASFKFVGYKMFSMMFADYDIIAKRFLLYAHIYPFIELGLGIAYLWNIAPVGRDLITAIVMGVGSIGVFQEIKKRSGVHCACLGNVIKLPLSTVSFVEDIGMGAMALLMLVSR